MSKFSPPSQRQLPILCKNCMGPAEPSLSGSIQCRYCGQADQLPPDQLARALELKRRLTMAKNSVANVDGMNGALSEIFEKRAAFWSAAGIYVVAAILVTGFSLFQALPLIERAPQGVKLAIFINSLMGGLWLGGIALSMLAAFTVGRRTYRKRVRHHLFARLPHQPGMPARCRACDGSLPESRDPFILCAYCGTRNLVTPELQANRALLAERERAFYAERSGHAIGAMRGASLNMSRTIVICGVLVYAAIIGLAMIASSSIS